MTIKEIAKIAGVSPSTVSKIINHPGMNHSSPEVQKKVWDIINQYGYIPNITAQRLRMNIQMPQCRDLGCIYAGTGDLQLDPFFSHVAKSISGEALKYGYQLSYSWSGKEIEENFWTLVQDLNISGIIVLGMYDQRLESILKKGPRKVVVCSLDSSVSAFDNILCDASEATTKAVTYLLKCGHTQIAFVGDPKRNIAQYNGYVNTLKEAEIPTNSSNIISAERSYQGGQKALTLLRKSSKAFTAAFIANDLTALGFLREAEKQNVSVPEELSVVSIYDIRAASYSNPPLTTVRIPADSLGRHAVLCIIDRIWNPKKQPIKIMLPTKLIIRESVKNIRK